MPAADLRILVVNPGSTSTKIGVFAGERLEFSTNVAHPEEALAPFRGRSILAQADLRARAIDDALAGAQVDASGFAAVAGRGGLLPSLASGTYVVDDHMLEVLRQAPRGEHASNLGAPLASAIAARTGIPAFVVDPVAVDEWPPVARLSGTPLLERECLSHALNSKAVAKRHAREQGRSYASLRLVVAHLGSGISVSAHRDGLMVDVTNSREEGAFSTERAGGVPAMQLAALCCSGRYTFKEVERLLFREGGLKAYLGTKDLVEVERRIREGDAQAAAVFEAMAYQIAKEIGAMATVLHGRVDAVLLTGGMAHSTRLVEALRDAISWIAPVTAYPGEDELQALAEGALRVLRGEEAAKTI